MEHYQGRGRKRVDTQGIKGKVERVMFNIREWFNRFHLTQDHVEFLNAVLILPAVAVGYLVLKLLSFVF